MNGALLFHDDAIFWRAAYDRVIAECMAIGEPVFANFVLAESSVTWRSRCRHRNCSVTAAFLAALPSALAGSSLIIRTGTHSRSSPPASNWPIHGRLRTASE